MNLKLYGILVLLLALISCNDNVVKEKDKYPEIPNLPRFKDNVFTSKKIAEIKLNKDINNKYYFRYLVKDTVVYIITFYTDSDHPDYPYGGEKYTVDLLVLNGNKINHVRWIDKDFDFNFDLDKDRNLTIGKRKYGADTKFKEYKLTISGDKKVDTLFKPWRQGALTDVNDFKAFDQVVIGSKTEVAGAENSPIFGFEHNPVLLTYYEVNYKNKKGLTKIDFRNEEYPLTIRNKKVLFYVTYKQDYIDAEIQTGIFSFYRIE